MVSKINIKKPSYFLILTMVLLVSLMLVSPVFADDEAPVEAPAQAPAEEAPPTEEAAILAPSEVVLPVEEPISAETAADAAVDAPADVVVDLGENDISLSGSDGEALDLASASSAAALTAPDPYFKVGTTYYRFFESATGCDAYPVEVAAGTCFDGEANPIQAAINYIDNNANAIPTERKIYVEGGDYTGNAIFDGTHPNLATLNGLIGLDGSNQTTITGSVSFSNLTGGFTLQGFTINGRVWASDITGTVTLKDVVVENLSFTGIEMHSNINGAIVLDEVTSSGNVGNGATIDNADGGKPYAITIKNSSFDENNDGVSNCLGLQISTLGSITMDGVSASRNIGAGIQIQTDFASLTIKNAVLVGNDAFGTNSSYGYGLFVDTTRKANVTLENILSSDDKEANGTSVSITTGGNVLIKNANIFDNAGTGLKIDTTSGIGTVKIYDSEFHHNGYTGLDIASIGSIYLSSIRAHDNIYMGAYIDNCSYSATACVGTGTVTITSPASGGTLKANDFSDNGGYGLNVTSGKAITLTNVSANNNLGGNGITLNNVNGSGGITLNKNIPSNPYYSYTNSASGNSTLGIYAVSNGAIRVEYLLANGNGNTGADLLNTNAPTAASVSVLYSEFNDNNYHGLNVESNGSIALTNVSANSNDFGASNYGAYLRNNTGVSSSVTVKGIKGYTCQFNENSERGLDINSNGVVTVSGIEAIGNTLGTRIDNYGAASAKNVTISNGVFNDTTDTLSDGYGLQVQSKGSITLNYVTAENNQWNGADLNSTYGQGSITVKYSSFNDNNKVYGWPALNIQSYKNVTLYNVSASNSGGSGVQIDNCQLAFSDCIGTGSVSVTSGKGYTNTFNDNGSYGIHINSIGNVTLANISASGNSAYGLYIQNTYGTISGNVTLSAGSGMRNTFENNGSSGLNITSKGSISISYSDSFTNNHSGAYLDNSNASTLKTIKIADSTFLNNLMYGIDASSLGTITLQGVESSDNTGYYGAYLNNFDGSGSVTILYSPVMGYGARFLNNGNAGLAISSKGAVSLSFVESRDNHFNGGGYGISINNISDAEQSVTLNTVSIEGSTGGAGLYLESRGNITLTKVTATNNINGRGAAVYNHSAPGSSRWVKVTNSIFSDNVNGNGLDILSAGNVTLNGVTAKNPSGMDGVYIDNTSGSGSVTLIGKDNIFDNNGEHGLSIESHGDVILSNFSANNNIQRGTYIRNAYFGYTEKNVKINNTLSNTFNTLNDNGSAGLYIYSFGTVTVDKVYASGNDENYIENTGASAYKKVTVTNSVFNDTFSKPGLSLYGYGPVSLTNVWAAGNGSSGVLVNTSSADGQDVTINGLYVDDNASGLFVTSKGTISLNKVSANGNTGFGVRLENNAGLEGITITSSHAENNLNSGFHLYSNGPVTIKSSDSIKNSVNGIYLQGGSTANVTLYQVNTLLNADTGIFLDNVANVSISLSNSLYNNAASQGDGLRVVGNGTSIITFLKSTFMGNYGDGAELINIGSYTQTSSLFFANDVDGNGDIDLNVH